MNEGAKNMAIIINGKELAAKVRADLKLEVEE